MGKTLKEMNREATERLISHHAKCLKNKSILNKNST